MLTSSIRLKSASVLVAAAMLVVGFGRLAPAHVPPVPASGGRTRYPIRHIIIIDKENHSFDNLFGLFPGADGASQALTSTGRLMPLGHTPDQTLLDVAHAGASALMAMHNGKMDRFDILPGARQDGLD